MEYFSLSVTEADFLVGGPSFFVHMIVVGCTSYICFSRGQVHVANHNGVDINGRGIL